MAIDLTAADSFDTRHTASGESAEMLLAVGATDTDDLVDKTIPSHIRVKQAIELPKALSEHELEQRAEELANRNVIFRSFIGMGYSDTITPPVILRNIFHNPNWYTQYTPYQAEISQGRLEALLNFQTAVSDLTGFEIANASLLDEGTAAAEAMMMFSRLTKKSDRNVFFVSESCHPQTIEVVKTRAEPLGIEVEVGNHTLFNFTENVFAALLQYPATDGRVDNVADFCARAQDADVRVICATDLLSLALLTPPGEFGADAAVGNSQRFGVPLGYGGPHAAFFATREKFKRQIPGRIIGVSVDADENRALRMALQTREQHIRRDKATSNICTAQVLLAVMAGAYAVYHGPKGIRRIATRVHDLTKLLAQGLVHLGFEIRHQNFFDTIRVDTDLQEANRIRAAAADAKINLRFFEDGSLGISLDETTSESDVDALFSLFGHDQNFNFSCAELALRNQSGYDGPCARTTEYLTHPTFSAYQTETEMMRYLTRLSAKDLSLTTSMIPLGSCTMKLNAVSELLPVSLPGFSRMHPFAPIEQTEGYRVVFEELSQWLAEITGFHGVSLQPNSGASGEYAGLLVIRAYHEANGEQHRNVCLIPESAHGTNPASAVMAGMKVVVTRCDDQGNIDLDDLRAKAVQHSANLAALMITYPSTHGVFESTIIDICECIHQHGGQVYMDGANMNAQVGLCRPGDFGADVCHLNLHKTFSIPHGGGGPGVGPICTAEHLSPYLPSHPLVNTGGETGIGPIAAAPWGSASILLISWAYIAMMGADGLTAASQQAILNANYIAKRLEGHFDILYTGLNGYCAHEFILDLRPFKSSAGVSEVDVAKRLMDYGFHAPTMSWPVVGTMMIEPTESESKQELDRFCDSMIAIREEIRQIEVDILPRDNNPLVNAPHTAVTTVTDDWARPYSRETAIFPLEHTKVHKYWPPVRRVNDAYGDRNLVCSCPPVEAYVES